MLARGRGLPGVGLVLFVLSTAALTRQAALQGVKDVRGRVVVEACRHRSLWRGLLFRLGA